MFDSTLVLSPYPALPPLAVLFHVLTAKICPLAVVSPVRLRRPCGAVCYSLSLPLGSPALMPEARKVGLGEDTSPAGGRSGTKTGDIFMMSCPTDRTSRAVLGRSSRVQFPCLSLALLCARVAALYSEPRPFCPALPQASTAGTSGLREQTALEACIISYRYFMLGRENHCQSVFPPMVSSLLCNRGRSPSAGQVKESARRYFGSFLSEEAFRLRSRVCLCA